jgi:hypothetical protein
MNPPSVMLNLFQYQHDGGEYKDQILKRVQHDGRRTQRPDTETVMLNLFQYQHDGGEYKAQILNGLHWSYEPLPSS